MHSQPSPSRLLYRRTGAVTGGLSLTGMKGPGRNLRRIQWLWLLSIGARVIAAALLIFGPWVDEPKELDGWDSSRFQEIAETSGQAYVDFDVEYPPGSVLAIELLAGPDVVSTNRRLVAASLVIDLALAALLATCWRRSAGLTYLLLGLPLVPAGLLRLDLWAAFAATAAAAALVAVWPEKARLTGVRWFTTGSALCFSVAAVGGALVKIWPVLLVPAAFSVGARKAAISATIIGGLAGLTWIAVSGSDAINQIVSLRGATGWHLESVPGSLVALFSDTEPVREADAFRIGHLQPWLVTVGRFIALGVAAWLAFLGTRRTQQGAEAETFALVMLGSVAMLIVTAPLLSPQFLLWLTPWAAMLPFSGRHRVLIGVTAAAITLTGATLAIFGPPDLDHPLAAILLLARDTGLVAIVILSARALSDDGSGVDHVVSRRASG